jgi:hypothetical protein
MRRGVGFASMQKGAEDLDELLLVDGATPQLKINLHMVGNWC